MEADKIGIIVAMEKEMAQLVTLLTDVEREERGAVQFVHGRLGQRTVVALHCGIGKVNAAMGTAQLLHYYAPQMVISTGVAGGARADLQVMDVVVGAAYTYHDVYCGQEVAYGQVMGQPARFTAPWELVQRTQDAGTSGHIHSGLIVSGDWFVDTREKMQSILDHFPDALAVDMESCAIAQVCHAHGVPFLSLRIISDVPLSDHRATQYYDFWDRLAEGSFEVTRQLLSQL